MTDPADQPAPQPPCEPVGIVEIAAKFDVSRKTVDTWRTRDLGFPERRWTVGGRPAWNWPDVERWGKENRRLPWPKADYLTLAEVQRRLSRSELTDDDARRFISDYVASHGPPPTRPTSEVADMRHQLDTNIRDIGWDATIEGAVQALDWVLGLPHAEALLRRLMERERSDRRRDWIAKGGDPQDWPEENT